MRIILLAITALSLAACHGSANSVLNTLVQQSTGHALAFADEPSENAAIPPIEPVVEPPVYVPPETEACEPGTHGFRLWDCDSTGHRAYW